jgi:hypothetical protein
VGSIVNTGEASFLMLNAVKSDDPAWAARLTQLEQLTASFRVSTGSGLSRIKGLGWAEG